MKNTKEEHINLKKELSNDNVFVKSSVVSLSQLTGVSTRKGLENAVLSESQIVNVVSNSYGHLPNERFFAEVEAQLIHADLRFQTRSINRENRSFAVDYILMDDNWTIDVKSSQDKIRPMLRFTNSYDGSCKTAGYFGYYREVCTNGLHVSKSKVGFSVKHRGNIVELVLPEVRSLVEKFMDNEFFSIKRKFEVFAETPIADLTDFVKVTAERFKLFQFECSEKNPGPSLNARRVLELIDQECKLLNTEPNLWIGYNAFNGVLHGKLKKTFDKQSQLDSQIFEALSAY